MFKRFPKSAYLVLLAALLIGAVRHYAIAGTPTGGVELTECNAGTCAGESGREDGEDPWSAQELIQPDELARALAGKSKPVVLQTGIVHLYRIGHIPGSKYAGQAGTPEGLETLRKLAQDIPRDSEIVFYCGCCPFKDCPNVRPAYAELRRMGFKKIRLLNLPSSFNQDWVAKGLPIEKGGA